MADLSSPLGSAGIGGANREGRRSTFGAPRRGGGMDCSSSRPRSDQLERATGASSWLSPHSHWTPRGRSNGRAPR
jgi:hypothetical protein